MATITKTENQQIKEIGQKIFEGDRFGVYRPNETDSHYEGKVVAITDRYVVAADNDNLLLHSKEKFESMPAIDDYLEVEYSSPEEQPYAYTGERDFIILPREMVKQYGLNSGVDVPSLETFLNDVSNVNKSKLQTDKVTFRHNWVQVNGEEGNAIYAQVSPRTKEHIAAALGIDSEALANLKTDWVDKQAHIRKGMEQTLELSNQQEEARHLEIESVRDIGKTIFTGSDFSIYDADPENKQYNGKIEAITKSYAVMNDGDDLILHSVSTFDRVPDVGSQVSISYGDSDFGFAEPKAIVITLPSDIALYNRDNLSSGPYKVPDREATDQIATALKNLHPDRDHRDSSIFLADETDIQYTQDVVLVTKDYVITDDGTDYTLHNKDHFDRTPKAGQRIDIAYSSPNEQAEVSIVKMPSRKPQQEIEI